MVVSFDLDGVLMENPFSKGIFPYIKRNLKNQYENHHNKSIKEEVIWENIKFEFNRRIKANLYTAYDWDDIIQTVADDLKLPGQINISKLINKYLEEPYIHLYEDGKKLLDKLFNADVDLYAVTNGYYKYQYPVMKALNIDNYFKEIITTDKSKAIKPEVEAFGVDLITADEWFHIGDSVIMDIYGANKVLAKTVLVWRDMPKPLMEESFEYRSDNNLLSNYLNEKIESELILNTWEYDQKLIYPDYLVYTLEEIFPVLLN